MGGNEDDLACDHDGTTTISRTPDSLEKYISIIPNFLCNLSNKKKSGCIPSLVVSFFMLLCGGCRMSSEKCQDFQQLSAHGEGRVRLNGPCNAICESFQLLPCDFRHIICKVLKSHHIHERLFRYFCQQWARQRPSHIYRSVERSP